MLDQLKAFSQRRVVAAFNRAATNNDQHEEDLMYSLTTILHCSQVRETPLFLDTRALLLPCRGTPVAVCSRSPPGCTAVGVPVWRVHGRDIRVSNL